MADYSKKNALQEFGDSTNESLFLPEKYQPQFMYHQLIGDTISVMIWHGGEVENSSTSLYLMNCNSYWDMEQLMNNLKKSPLIAKRIILSVGYKECRTIGFDITKCVSNLKSIIAILRNRGCEEIILTNVPPCAGACHKLIHWQCLQAINQAMKTLDSEEDDIVLCNIFQLFCYPINVKRRQEYVINNAPNYTVHFDLYNAKSPRNPAVNDLISLSNKGKKILVEHLCKTINYRVDQYLTKLINARLNLAASNKCCDTNNNTRSNENKFLDISSKNDANVDNINTSSSINQKLNSRDRLMNNISKPKTLKHSTLLSFKVDLSQTGYRTQKIQKPLLTQEEENKTEEVHFNPNLSKAKAHDNEPNKLMPDSNLKLKTELTQTENKKTQPNSTLPLKTDLTQCKNKETQLSKSVLLERNFNLTQNEETLPNPNLYLGTASTVTQNKKTQPDTSLPIRNNIRSIQNKGTSLNTSSPLFIDFTDTQNSTSKMIKKKSVVTQSKVTQVNNCLPFETDLMDSSNKEIVMNPKEFITKNNGNKPKLSMNTNLEKITLNLNLENEPNENLKLCNENSRFPCKKIKLMLNKSPATNQMLKSIISLPNSKASIPKKVESLIKKIPSTAYTIPKISNAFSICVEKETDQRKDTHKKKVIIGSAGKKFPKSDVLMKGSNSVKPKAVPKTSTRSSANLGAEKVHPTLTKNGMKENNGVKKCSVINLDANYDKKKDRSTNLKVKVKEKVVSKSASKGAVMKGSCTETPTEPPKTVTGPQFHHLPKLNPETEMELFLKPASTETKKRKNIEENPSTKRRKTQGRIFFQHDFICNCKVCKEGHKKLIDDFHNLIKMFKKEQEKND